MPRCLTTGPAHPAQHRAEAAVAGSLETETDQTCRVCGDTLPAIFFGKRQRMCRSCTSDYDRQRRAAAPPVAAAESQECAHCGRRLPASDFMANRLSATGLTSWCKHCSAKASMATRALNKVAPRPAAALAPTKICSGCRKALPRAAFYTEKRNWDGLRTPCKVCWKKQIGSAAHAMK